MPFTMRREPRKYLPGRGGTRGGQLPSAAVGHWCTRTAALWGAQRSCSSWWLRSSHTKYEVPQPEHVLEELVYGGPSRRVVAGNRAELHFCRFGHQPRTGDLRHASQTPRSHPERLVPGQDVSVCLLYRLAVVGPEEP